MKNLPKLTALALAAFMSTGSLVAYAATTDAPAYQTQQEMLKTADEALSAITQAHAARLALFANDIEAAKTKVAAADQAFLDAEKTLNDMTIGDTEDPSNAQRYLPFDMSMTLSEDFTVTDESKEALDKANGLIQQGSTDDAIEVLRLASVDVNVTSALLPVVATTDQLEQARTLIDEGKYFEANLALKAIEDSVIVRSFSIDAIPQQGAVN
ncbi:MAG: YfdX family protein [Paracoccaceae bacterium]